MFTDQKPRIATEDDLKAKWNGDPNNFRCYLCGHKFQLGDTWRFVSSTTWKDGEPNCASFVDEFTGKKYSTGNILVCQPCDGPDVMDRWIQRNTEAYSLKFWAIMSREGTSYDL